MQTVQLAARERRVLAQLKLDARGGSCNAPLETAFYRVRTQSLRRSGEPRVCVEAASLDLRNVKIPLKPAPKLPAQQPRSQHRSAAPSSGPLRVHALGRMHDPPALKSLAAAVGRAAAETPFGAINSATSQLDYAQHLLSSAALSGHGLRIRTCGQRGLPQRPLQRRQRPRVELMYVINRAAAP